MNYDSTNRDPDVEKLLDTLHGHKAEVYRFMRDEYERITNNGDNYDVEQQDDMVAKAASEKFSISEEQAGSIYVEVEVKISKLWLNRS